MNESKHRDSVIKTLSTFNKDCLNILKRTNTLTVLIVKELLAENLREINIEETELDSKIDKFKANQNLKTDEDYNDWLSKSGLNETEFRNSNLYELKKDTFIKNNFQHKVEAEFLQQKDKLDLVVYSLARVKDVYKARELILRISDGEDDFSKIAAEHSEGPEKSTRGVVGPVQITKAHPVLAEILRTSPVGEVKGPIKLGEWFLIVRVEELRHAVLDQELSTTIAQQLMQRSIQEEADSIVKMITK